MDRSKAYHTNRMFKLGLETKSPEAQITFFTDKLEQALNTAKIIDTEVTQNKADCIRILLPIENIVDKKLKKGFICFTKKTGKNIGSRK